MLARQLARRAAPLAAARRLTARPVAGYHTTVEGEEGTESWRMKFSVRAQPASLRARLRPLHPAPGRCLPHAAFRTRAAALLRGAAD